jgi:hypothetical protein
MEQEPLPSNTRQEIALLLGQLHPTPTAEWVAHETDRIMEKLEGPPPDSVDPS